MEMELEMGDPTPEEIINLIESNRVYKTTAPQPAQFFIFPAQIDLLVRLDAKEDGEGRSYDTWVEMLTKHGWTVISPEEMIIDA